MKNNIFKTALAAACLCGIFLQSCEDIPEYEQEYKPVVAYGDFEQSPVEYINVLGTEKIEIKKKIVLKSSYSMLKSEETVRIAIDSSSSVSDKNAVKVTPESFVLGGSLMESEVTVTVDPSAFKGGYDRISVLKIKTDTAAAYPFKSFWTIRPAIENTEEWKGPYEAFVWEDGLSDAGDEPEASWMYVAKVKVNDTLPDRIVLTNFWNAEADGGEEITLRLEGKGEGIVILEKQPVVSYWNAPNPVIYLQDTVGTFTSDGIDKQIQFDYRLLAQGENGEVLYEKRQTVRLKKIDLNSLSGIVHHNWELAGEEFENTVNNQWTYADLWYGDFMWHGKGTTFDLWRNSTEKGNSYDANILYVYNQSVLGVLNDGQPTLDMLAEGHEIGAGSDWVRPETGGQAHYPVVASPGLTDRHGKTFYVGFTIQNIYDSGLTHYGWLKCKVSAGGSAVTYLQAAFNMKPEASIKAGQIE